MKITTHKTSEAAVQYLKNGFSVIPVSQNKIPIVPWKEFQTRFPTEEEVRGWFDRYPNAGVGIVTGKLSRLTVVDSDNPIKTNEIEEALPDNINVVIEDTPRGGRHYFFAYTPDLRQLQNPQGIDVRNDGGYVRVFPTQGYKMPNPLDGVNGLDPVPIEVKKLIDPNIKCNSGNGGNGGNLEKNKPGWEQEVLSGVDEGTRNASLTKEAGRLIQKGLTKEEILLVLKGINSQNNPPLKTTEVEGIVDSVFKTHQKNHPDDAFQQSGSSPPIEGIGIEGLSNEEARALLDIDFSDTENARRFLKLTKGSFLWIQDIQKWWYYDPERPGWGDGELAVSNQMKKVAEAVNNLALRMPFTDDMLRIKVLKQCIAWKDRYGIDNAVYMLRDEDYSYSNEFDTDPYLFLCKNGVFDLKIGKLRDSTPSDKLHKLSPIVYDKHATCPQWERFLDEIFMGDKELIFFVQKFCGYTLTGNTGEEKFLILEGPGANGKSTLLEVIAGIMGEYGVPIPFATFKDPRWDQGGNAHQADLVQMIGARFVRSVEVKEQARLNIERLKSLTGNDMMSARPPYARDAIKFYPVGKIWLAVNHLPKIYDTTNSCWRRLLRVPFNYVVPLEKRIKDFSKKLLLEESSGIFNWMFDGCYIWQREGIDTTIPKAVESATNEYQLDSNPVKQFIKEQCEEGRYEVPFGEFYEAFAKQWVEDNGPGINPMGKAKVGTELQGLGYERRDMNRVRFYVGLRLK